MIQCPICRLKPFDTIVCNSTCQHYSSGAHWQSGPVLVGVTVMDPLKIMIEEMFGEEIKDYE